MKPCLYVCVALLLFSFILVSCNEDEAVAPQNKLVAVAGEDQTVLLNTPVTLDGSLSSDGNHKTFSSRWKIKSKPDGSTASILAPDAERTSFNPDRVGTYVVQLTISQAAWTAQDELLVTVTSHGQGGPEAIRISEDIMADRTLTDIFEDPSHPDYIVTKDIDVRAHLTVMPGVVVAFEENTGLQIISGSLFAKGTSEKEIVFRGVADHLASWKGIFILSNSESNELDHVTIKQGGSSVFAESGVKANIAVAGSDHSGGAIKISHSVIRESGGYGLYLQGTSTLNLFLENTFVDNAAAPVYVPAGQLHKIVFAGSSGLTAIETGGPVLGDEQITWKSFEGGYYLVSSDILIHTGLTIEPGAVFKMMNGRTIEVNYSGYLQAIGTEALKITFTSTDSNVYWDGLFFNTYNFNNTIQYAEISRAGLNRIADADFHGNVVVGHNGLLNITNSVIKDGLGYGLVAKTTGQVNQDVAAVNLFDNLATGFVYPQALDHPDRPDLEGEWVDRWSFDKGYSAVSSNFYDHNSGTWFEGAATPWLMNAGYGMGIRFEPDGSFIWNIAERSPMTGCESFSAEHITGTATYSSEVVFFDLTYWRSMFINKCDETQNVDIEVTPSQTQLSYEINKLYTPNTGEAYWELKFINPDNSSFSLYRKAN